MATEQQNQHEIALMTRTVADIDRGGRQSADRMGPRPINANMTRNGNRN